MTVWRYFDAKVLKKQKKEKAEDRKAKAKCGRKRFELPTYISASSVEPTYVQQTIHGVSRPVIHEITGRLVNLHRRWGDARLLRWLGRFSVGQAREALDEILLAEPDTVSVKSERLASALSAAGAVAITMLDPEYPPSLRVLDADAPPLLYVIGNLDRLKTKSIAIIGTRRPSAPGRAAARTVAEGVSRRGWCVVSGNAPGIDSNAHGASVAAGGETLVFPPVPLDEYEPSFRDGTPERVTVASPFVPGSAIGPWMFLRRNSLVAAQCCAAFIAETGTRGGTLDTLKKLHKLQRSTFATALPEDAKFSNAHKMVSAGGVRLLEISDPYGLWLSTINDAAEDCRRTPLPSTPILDDFFPEEVPQ